MRPLKAVICLVFVLGAGLYCAEHAPRKSQESAEQPPERAEVLLGRAVQSYVSVSMYRDTGVARVNFENRDVSELAARLFSYIRYGRNDLVFATEFSSEGESRFTCIRPDGSRYEASGSASFGRITTPYDSRVAASWRDGLVALTGISGGASNIVPPLLLADPASGLRSLALLTGPHLATVNGVNCYVLEGENQRFRFKIWIDRVDHHLVRVERVALVGNAGSVRIDYLDVERSSLLSNIE